MCDNCKTLQEQLDKLNVELTSTLQERNKLNNELNEIVRANLNKENEINKLKNDVETLNLTKNELESKFKEIENPESDPNPDKDPDYEEGFAAFIQEIE